MSSLEFISAGAGSGKTYTLTRRLSDLLQAGQVRPAGVIATTFTRKAATELRERVRQRLLQEGHFRLACAMGQASIGTVNSVCGELLQRFAFEAGLAPRQRVIDEDQADTLLLHAIDAARSSTQLAGLLTLARRLGIEDWVGELKQLVNQARANDIDTASLAGFAVISADDLLGHFPNPQNGDPSVALLSAIDEALAGLEPAAQASGKKNSRDYVEYLQACRRRLQDGVLPWSDWVGLIGAAPEKALLPFAEPVQACARNYDTHPRLHADIREWLQTMFVLAADVLTHYQQRKRDLGVLDFTDQEHLALQLLDHQRIRATLAEELDLLLVDEFQDTSPIQLALFTKLQQLARNTCWVGDIKQAIYGFRGSDTALMQSILAALPDMGGSASRLQHSYRSLPQLVALVNNVFRDAFSGTLRADEIELQAQRPTLPGQPVFANWYLQGSNIGLRTRSLVAGVSRLLQAGRQVVDRQHGQPRPMTAGDIAILSRSNEGVGQIAAALAAAGIPVATARAGLLHTPEATLAMACLRRLNDPADTVATAEIFALADAQAPEEWLADRLRRRQQGDSGHDWGEEPERLHPILTLLAQLRVQLPLLAPAEALQRVIISCGLTQRVMQWQQGPDTARRRIANLEALMVMAGEYEERSGQGGDAATISGLILWLQQMALQEKDEQAMPAVDAVRVLTHHAAKGLEWPVVILTDLEKPARSRLWGINTVTDARFNAHQPLAKRRIRYWPWPFGKRSAGIDVSDRIGQTAIARQYQQAADDEAKRLLYVSMTRARDMLVLAHNAKSTSNEWLALLQADWLLHTKPAAGTLELPDKQQIACEHWELDEAVSMPPKDRAGQQLYCFPLQPPVARLPMVFNPSRAEASPASLTDRIQIGERLNVAREVDWDVLGNAVHACLALSFCCIDTPVEQAEIEQIFARYGLADVIEAQVLQQQIRLFHNWLAERWPGHGALAEVPVCATLPNGQRLRGRIDLLLETAEGYVLFDHKSSPLPPDQWQRLADTHAGQLEAYAMAIEQATGRQVCERWLFLPVAGGAARILPGVHKQVADAN